MPITLIVLMITACSKDPDGGNDPAAATVVGAWLSSEVGVRSLINGVTVVDSTENYQGATFTFTNNNLLYLTVDATAPESLLEFEDDTSYYNWAGSTLILRAGPSPNDTIAAIFNIERLTRNIMELYTKQQEVKNGITHTDEITIELTRN